MLLTALGIGLFACAFYLRSATFGLSRTDDRVLLDEDAYFLTHWEHFGELFTRPFFPPDAGRSESYYRPLVTLSFMVDAAWGGMRPYAFHVTNVLLHGLASSLLLLLLLHLGFDLPLAAAGSALFALHPALTEAVVWIPGRCDILLGVFAFASSISYLRYIDRRSPMWLGAHMVALLAALLSKEAAVTIPVLLIAWSLWVDPHRSVLRRAPIWLAWATAGGLWALGWNASQGAGHLALGHRLVTLSQHLPALLMHLGKIAIPYNVTTLAIYSDTSWTAGAVILPLLALAVWRLHGRDRRVLLWGLALFLLFLLPTLMVSDFLILENRLYVPTAGLIIVILAIARGLLQPRRARFLRPTLIGLAVITEATFGLLSWRYTDAFRNNDTFTADAVRGSPHSSLAHLNRGIVYQERHQPDLAAQHYHEALRLNPRQPVVHNNLGLIYLARGDLAAAEAEFRAELMGHAGYAKAHFNLSLVLQRTGRIDEALRELRATLRWAPNDVDAMRQLYGLHSVRGEVDAADRYRTMLRQHGLDVPELRPMTPKHAPGS